MPLLADRSTEARTTECIVSSLQSLTFSRGSPLVAELPLNRFEVDARIAHLEGPVLLPAAHPVDHGDSERRNEIRLDEALAPLLVTERR